MTQELAHYLPSVIDIARSAGQMTLDIYQKKDYQAYIDLDNLSLGQHRVKVQYRNISDNLNVVVKPDIVNVTIEERDSKQFSVEASYDKNKVKNGYEAGEATVSPRAVTVTGASSQLAQVAYVKAIIDLDNPTKIIKLYL